jgi:hypothetical protein
MTAEQWQLRVMCLASEKGADISFCGLNDNAVWCIHETGSAFCTPWECAVEYLENEHGIRVEPDGTVTSIPKGVWKITVVG